MNDSKTDHPKVNAREFGFTLTELMVTIGIFTILITIGIPGFIKWLPDYRLKSAARDLYSTLQLARLTAIKSGTNGTITFNQPVDSTTYGYVVFKDADNDLEYESGEVIVKKGEWGEYEGVSVSGNTFTVNDDSLPCLAFRSNGIPVNNTGGFGAGTVSLVNTNGKDTDVVVSAAGNVRIQ